ncbi:MAG TPA: helix-turn-helix domain-containing protein [Candidatus Acidoferrum sp.]|nr:helix-turn-helix domain-containing protein [Candidatus Acidoferrum sp.]
MSALGEEFRSAREARSLSLSDVAERLHIRSVYLAAIEDEDWHVIGAPVYVRGFMRTYARFLGLDPEAAVARFAATIPAGTPAATAPRQAAPANAAERRAAAERSSPSPAAVLSIVAAVLVVLFVGYEFYQYRAGAPGSVPVADASAAAPGVAAAPPDASAGTPAPDGGDDTLAAIPPLNTPVPAALRTAKRGLSLHVTETSWLRVTVDGNVVLEGTLPAGAAKTFTGKIADVRVGNAGGVRIAVNGHTLGPLGASGDVVERRFVLSGE